MTRCSHGVDEFPALADEAPAPGTFNQVALVALKIRSFELGHHVALRNLRGIGRAVWRHWDPSIPSSRRGAERFEKALTENPLPVRISEVRFAADPLNAMAKGALVAALTET